MSDLTIADPTTVHRRRRDHLRSLIAQSGSDAALISDLVNVRYLSGFTGSNAALLVDATDADQDRISTDGRYITQVDEQAPDVIAVIGRDCPAVLLGARIDAGGGRIALEEHSLTVGAWRALAQQVDAANSTVELSATGRMVEQLRMIKDAGEVELLAQACLIGDTALAAIIDAGVIRSGATERDVARALEFQMYGAGADEISFETIVAAGANSAIPHHRPSDATLSVGDFVKIDFGATVGGYHSDMTRTYVLGEVADWQRDIYGLVHAAQEAGRAALAVGANLADVDAAARSIIADAGHGDHYVHGLGHGVGLEIHEAPSIGAASTGTLPQDAAVTVEPGVYLPGFGGVRIEDTLMVRDGAAQLLTTTDRALTVI